MGMNPATVTSVGQHRKRDRGPMACRAFARFAIFSRDHRLDGVIGVVDQKPSEMISAPAKCGVI